MHETILNAMKSALDDYLNLSQEQKLAIALDPANDGFFSEAEEEEPPAFYTVGSEKFKTYPSIKNPRLAEKTDEKFFSEICHKQNTFIYSTSEEVSYNTEKGKVLLWAA